MYRLHSFGHVMRSFATAIGGIARLPMQLARWYWLDRQQRLVAFDYAYRPRTRDWSRSPAVAALGERLREGEQRYAATLREFAAHAEHFADIPMHAAQGGDPGAPHWFNGWFPPLDAISLMGFIATRAPRTYVEVGSGNSTRFARWAIRRCGLSTRIVSIDPHPRAQIDALCDEVLRAPFEDVADRVLERLTGEDLLVVDSSHRAFPGSDVTVFFMETLPALPAGLLYGVHDICLPRDYPPAWNARYYNEQYLLGAYLLGGAGGDTVMLPNAYVGTVPALHGILEPVWRNPRLKGADDQGSLFWMQAG